MRNSLILAAFVSAALATPVANAADSCGFDNSLDAVVSALTISKNSKTASKHEYGGLVYKTPDGDYCHTKPETSFERYAFNIKISLPRGVTKVAIYHNHPGGGNNINHSEGDVAFATALGIPSYIVTRDNIVMKFDPATDKVPVNIRTEVSSNGFRGTQVATIASN